MAAILQSCDLVRQLALRGEANPYQVRPLLHSLFVFDANNTSEIYGDLRLLDNGYKRFHQYLNNEISVTEKELLQYTLRVLFISKMLIKRDDYSNVIRTRLEQLNYSSDESFENNWRNLPKEINEIYKITASNLDQRIEVRGDKLHLENPQTAARVRTLLLASIRAGILWHQLGGSKWSLFFNRGDYKKTLEQLSPVNR